jgi:hypothetical protein
MPRDCGFKGSLKSSSEAQGELPGDRMEQHRLACEAGLALRFRLADETDLTWGLAY